MVAPTTLPRSLEMYLNRVVSEGNMTGIVAVVRPVHGDAAYDVLTVITNVPQDMGSKVYEVYDAVKAASELTASTPVGRDARLELDKAMAEYKRITSRSGALLFVGTAPPGAYQQSPAYQSVNLDISWLRLSNGDYRKIINGR